MAHDVFISYSVPDKAVADAVCATLESRKIRCWIAPRDVLPGMSYAEALIDALNRSSIFVLVFSGSSNNSPQVMREVERAVNKGIPIIPFRIEDVTPSKAMEYFLSTPHWLDAMTPPLEKHLHRLADTVQVLLTTELEKLRAPSIEREFEPPTPTTPLKVKWWKKVKRVHILTGSVVIVLIVVGVIVLTGGFGRLHETPSDVLPNPPSNSTSPLTPSGNVSIVKEVTVPLMNINGITWDGTDLWIVTNSGDLFKMNTNGDVLTTCRSPEVTPEGLTWDGEAFWVFSTNYSYIYRFSIDESGAKPEVRTLSFFKSPNEIIGGTNDGLAWDGANLWYSDRYSVHKLDIEGTVLGGFASAHEVAGLCWDGEYLWLAYDDATLAQVDTEGKILHSFDLPVSPIDTLTWAEGYLWAVVSDPFADESKIYALEPQTVTSVSEGHEVVTSVESTGFLALYSARGIAWDGTYLWLTDVSSGQLLKMTPDGETLGTYLSPAISPLGLTWDGAAFWIFDSEKDEICQFTLDESGDVP
jgi:hypothetical protein